MTTQEIATEIRLAFAHGTALANDHQKEMYKLAIDFELKKMELMNANLAEQVKLSRVMQEREFAQMNFQEKLRGEE